MEKEFEHRLTVVEDRSKSNTIRLDELEKRQDDLEKLTTTVNVLAIKEENIESDVKEIKSDVKEIISKPKKREDKIIELIIASVISVVMGYFFAKLGM